jgi:hypothetical protein
LRFSCIDGLCDRSDEAAVFLAGFHDARKVPLLPAQAIELPDEDAVDCLVFDGTNKSVELRPLRSWIKGRDVHIFENIDHLPCFALSMLVGIL